MTRGEGARHRAPVRAGERCGIRRQYPSRIGKAKPGTKE